MFLFYLVLKAVPCAESCGNRQACSARIFHNASGQQQSHTHNGHLVLTLSFVPQRVHTKPPGHERCICINQDSFLFKLFLRHRSHMIRGIKQNDSGGSSANETIQPLRLHNQMESVLWMGFTCTTFSRAEQWRLILRLLCASARNALAPHVHSWKSNL